MRESCLVDGGFHFAVLNTSPAVLEPYARRIVRVRSATAAVVLSTGAGHYSEDFR